MNRIKRIACFAFWGTAFCRADAQQAIPVDFDVHTTFQTISSFGASDAWACQFAGNWPEDKKNRMADWLFSLDMLANGNPKGIGLSLWRYNLGAGSAEQKAGSGIRDEWRRAALTTGADPRVQAQNWFLQAAQKRGVGQFLGFFNSPPVSLTRNGKAYAVKGQCNIDSSRYGAFAAYAVAALRQIQKTTGITLNYISPVNEPQWDWSDGGQEGCPYRNAEISGLVREFSHAFQQNRLATKILVGEAGHLKYLLRDEDKPGKGDQVLQFFQPSAPHYIGGLPNVCRTIAAHSYFTTSPFSSALSIRKEINKRIDQIPGLQFWQSEYCILGDNGGEIDGRRKDTGMNAALYLAKVVYEDLVFAGASSWQWWTALSAYDYKDGLIYLDKKESDGNFTDSKMLWALGNYSRFIRPGMQRINLNPPAEKGLYFSAYKEEKGKQLVFVFVNENAEDQMLLMDKTKKRNPHQKNILYLTDAAHNLSRSEVSAGQVLLPGKSILTVLKPLKQ